MGSSVGNVCSSWVNGSVKVINGILGYLGGVLIVFVLMFNCLFGIFVLIFRSYLIKIVLK